MARPELMVHNPHLAPPEEHPEGVEILRSTLDDDSVEAPTIRRSAHPHPDTAGAALRLVLDDPSFSWEEEGQALLRDREPPCPRTGAHTGTSLPRSPSRPLPCPRTGGAVS